MMRNRWMRAVFCFAWLAVLPICFGGAHSSTWFLFGAAGAFLLLLGLNTTSTPIGSERGSERAMLLWRLVPRYVGISIVAPLFALTLVGFFHLSQTTTHPVLKEAHYAFAERLWSIAAGLCIFFAPLFALRLSDATLLRRALQLSGIAMATVGLGSWFEDNGALFGVFSPDHVFVSTRARWPFVNPNHFAAFMLVPLLLSFYRLLEWGHAAIQKFYSRERRTGRDRARGLETPTLSLACVMFCGLGLVAAQSRTGWGIGGAAMVVMTIVALRSSALGAKQKLLASIVAICLGVGAAGLLSSFQQVDEVITERISAATTHTGQDARFKYYVDSLQLLREHPLVGAGPDGFKREVERIARPELSGLNPVYLHNEVLQVFVEYGVLVGILVLFAFVRITRSAPSALRLCFYSIMLSSCFDFPWRIGALVAQWGMLLALSVALKGREASGFTQTDRESRSGAHPV
jgi:hypothetical protein